MGFKQRVKTLPPDFWSKELRQYFDLWVIDMRQGMRPYTPLSAQNFERRFILYTRRAWEGKTEGLTLNEVFTLASVYSVLSQYSVESYSNLVSSEFKLIHNPTLGLYNYFHCLEYPTNKHEDTKRLPKSFTAFSDLNLQPSVLESLEKMGFTSMTPVQAQAIPHLLSGVDFLCQAPTGTGKTAAFSIPLVNQIEPGSGKIQALIIAPTRELVQQITHTINEIGNIKGVKALAIFGGERIRGQQKNLREKSFDVVVGTPGRLLDLLSHASFDFSGTRLVVLDESDLMLDMGFIDDIERILAHTPQGRQTWLFSATMSPQSLKIANRYLMYPEEVRIQSQHSEEIIDQYYCIVEEDGKVPLLKTLLKETTDLYGIVFVQSKVGVSRLAHKLRQRFPVSCVHGDMEQRERDIVLEGFRNREYKLLVATDVLSRGIDIAELTHVINFSPPRDPDDYIHRIGRTARAGASGIALTLFTPDEKKEYLKLEKRIGRPLKPYPSTMDGFRETKPKKNGQRSSRFGKHSPSPKKKN